MNYYSTKYFSEIWHIPVKKIPQYCRNGQIIGCRKIGGEWEIPDTAIRPIDKSEIPFLLMYYNCIQTGLDIRNTNIPYVQKFFALTYSEEARQFLIQMGYMNEMNSCTSAGSKMMKEELKKQQWFRIGKWVLDNIPQYLAVLPYIL